MTIPVAFHRDEALKKDLLDRIDLHRENGTLVLADTAWDGKRGSPLGVSVEGTDPADYVRRYGYPLSLAALLDPLAANPVEAFDAGEFVRQWVAVVRPGANLFRVASELMLLMLDDPRVAACDPGTTATLIALHRRDRDGDMPSRAEWAKARQTLLASAASPSPASALIEAGAWSATVGRSSLTSAFDAWRRLQSRIEDPAWSPDDEDRKEALLRNIWDAAEPARVAGEHVDYHAKLHECDPDLADRFLVNLGRVNALHLGAAERMAMSVIKLLESA